MDAGSRANIRITWKACCHRLQVPFPEILTQDVWNEPGGCAHLTDFWVMQRLLLSGPGVAQHE